MDIDLLSRMVKELILVNDRVTLPGVGAFVAEMVPASFSDRGYTINPPYRRLAFRQGASYQTDELLASMYAEANGIGKDAADKVLRGFLQGMIQELEQRKVLVFTGLGRLRATRENNFFFVCDEDLDIFPEGLGLEPVSLKSHSKPVSFDFSEMEDAIGSVPEIKVIPAPEDASQTVPMKDVPEQPEESAPSNDTPEGLSGRSHGECGADDVTCSRVSLWKRKWFVALFVLFCIAALLALAYGVFLLLAKYSPELVDKLLYSAEELDILNRKL